MKRSAARKKRHEETRTGWLPLEASTRHEIIATLGVLVALALCVALGTYQASDLAESNVSTDVHNLMGPPGAWLANGLVLTLGACAWVLPALLFFFSLRGYRRMQHPRFVSMAAAGTVVLLSFTAMVALIANNARGADAAVPAGGLVGNYLADKAASFGLVGSYLVLIAVILLGLALTTDLGPWTLLVLGARRTGAAWRAVPRPSLPSFHLPENWLRREPVEADEEEYEEEEVSPHPESALGDELVLRLDGYTEPEPDLFVLDEPPQDDLLRFEAPIAELDAPLSGAPEITTDMKEIAESRKRRKAKRMHPAHEGAYVLPPLELLNLPTAHAPEIFRDEIQHNSMLLTRTLSEFGMDCRVVAVSCGPVVTRYELQPPPGVKISRITSLSDNIALSLKATRVRIIAPIPGKGTVGIEVPNKNRTDVMIYEVLADDEYQEKASPLKMALGKTISGRNYTADLTRMPHLLIAGATGTGKSVCINTIITSMLFNATPDQVKFLMIDPKRVELKLYSDIPHLLYPVITDTRQAGAALEWLVEEMERRYGFLAKAGCRDMTSYNAKRQSEMLAIQRGELDADPDFDLLPARLPYIVLVIDELADLMTVARAEVETMIIRLAQMARAVGIHLVMATQRPSVDVITGLIKANFPSRIAFRVASKVDSRTILDENGAEALLGLGDMLFTQPGGEGPIRLQGCLITTTEAERVVEHCKVQRETEYLDVDLSSAEGSNADETGVDPHEEDELYGEAVAIVLDNDAASTSLLQRRLKVGYGRAARLLDLMEKEGLIGPPRGSKPREILVGR